MFDTAFRTPYRPFFISTFLSALGSWMHNVAAAILVYQLTGSAFATGMVSAAQFGMILLLAPIAGRVTDSLDKRLIILGWHVVTVGAAGTLAVLVALDRYSTVSVILTALAMGASDGMAKPATQAILPSLVGPYRVEKAVALNSVCYNFGRALGPAIGGTLAVAGTSWMPFALNASASVVSFVLLVRVRAPREGPAVVRRMTGAKSLFRDPRTRLILMSGVAVALAADPALTLAPQMAAQAHQSSGFAGVIGSGFGIGSLAAFAGMSKVRRNLDLARMAIIGLGLSSSGVAAVSVTSTSHVLVLVAISVAGAGFMTSSVALVSLAQQYADPGSLGRVMAAWGAAFLGMRPVAAMLNGAIADLAGLAIACLFAAFPAIVMAWRLAIFRDQR